MARPDPRPLRKLVGTITPLLLSVLLGCRAPPEDPVPEERVVPVEVVAAESLTVTDKVTVSGTIAPVREVDLSSEGTGRVLSVRAQLGDRVRKGQVLARLDSRTQRAQLAQAQAKLRGSEGTLALARSASERSERLADEGARAAADRDRARVEFDGAQAGVDAAQAGVTLARQAVANTRLRAPWSGTISAVRLEEGKLVGPGQPAFRLVDIDTVRVRLGVPGSAIDQLRPGQRAEVFVHTLGTTPIEGSVAQVGPEADSRSHTYPVEIEVDNASGRLRAGMMARVSIVVGRRPDAVVIPDIALVEGSRPHVFVVEGETAHRRSVVPGLRNGSKVEISDGLAAGEAVVTLGRQHLSEGTRVRLYSMGEGPGPTADADQE